MAGEKFDGDKPMWACVPLPLIEGIARTMTYGAKKYNENPDDPNWIKVDGGKHRYYSAMMRHLCAFQSGETIDPESKLEHLDHFLFNAMAFCHFAKEENDGKGN